jgi:hypothetical protein
MGGKKQCQTVLKGSLRTHWLKYINNVDIQVNPADRPGSNMAAMLHKTVYNLPSHYV